jgi:two-component system, OmpR family, phosphate regulon sensor histidine kinase PhoR
MPKLHNFFLYNFLGIYIATLFITSLVGYFALKRLMFEQAKYELNLTLHFAAMTLPHTNDLNRFSKEIEQFSKDRVTIIDNTGKILAESRFNKKQMQNHLNRPELVAAKKTLYGTAVRTSQTLQSKFLYIAEYLKYKNSHIYIRVSKDLNVLYNSFYTIYIKILAVFLGFMLLGLFITYKMSKKVQYDIDQITDYLGEISEKNYKAVVKTRYFNEFLYISLLLKNLVKKLANREKKKNKYNAKLRLVNKQRIEMLSAISHEFKNPVAAIVGYAETIRDDEQINLSIRNRFLDKILANAQKISTMIDRLALAIKLENNNLTVTAVQFDLLDLCMEIKNNFSVKYKNRNIHIDIKPLLLFADKTMMELVITNLIDNALKYSEEDVDILLEGTTLYVNDKGIGFDESQKEKITAKFYRVKSNSWDNSMGLGLAIVSYILNLHGIKLLIKSRPNIGSSFGFDLQTLIRHDT